MSSREPSLAVPTASIWRWAAKFATQTPAGSVETFFRTFGVNPLLGRTIADADDKRGCPVIGVLSYDFWQREYGGMADVFDRRLTLNTYPVRIVGVAPRGFTGIQVGEAVDVYMPLCAEGIVHRGAEPWR